MFFCIVWRLREWVMVNHSIVSVSNCTAFFSSKYFFLSKFAPLLLFLSNNTYFLLALRLWLCCVPLHLPLLPLTFLYIFFLLLPSFFFSFVFHRSAAKRGCLMSEGEAMGWCQYRARAGYHGFSGALGVRDSNP